MKLSKTFSVSLLELGDDAEYWKNVASGTHTEDRWLDRLPQGVRDATIKAVDDELGAAKATRSFSVAMDGEAAVKFVASAWT